jgi:hypothetical protein
VTCPPQIGPGCGNAFQATPGQRYGWTDHGACQGAREISGVRFWRTGHWSGDVTPEAEVFPIEAILPFLLVSHRPFTESINRRKLPGSGNPAHAPGVYLSGKRNSSGRNEYGKEIQRQLVGWYGSGSGGIRGFRVLPGKNNFDWSCRDKVYLGQGWVPDYLYLGLIYVKRLQSLWRNHRHDGAVAGPLNMREQF